MDDSVDTENLSDQRTVYARKHNTIANKSGKTMESIHVNQFNDHEDDGKMNIGKSQRVKSLPMRNFNKFFRPTEADTNEDKMLSAAKSIITVHNTPKINLLLILTAEKILTESSNLLLEPLIALLSDEHIGVRSLTFLFLSNLQKFYKDKAAPLLMLYIESLKIKNWHLREETLKLIA